MTRHVQPPSRADTTVIPVARRAGASAQTARTAAGPDKSLILLCIGLVAAIMAGSVLLLSYTRERALADTRRELANTAHILAGQADRSLQAIQLVQDSIVAHVRVHGITSPQEFKAKMATRDVHQMLSDKISGLPFVSNLSVIDTDGILVNFAEDWPIPHLDVSDRPHFQAAVRLRGTYLSAPVQSRTKGVWNIYHLMPVTAANDAVVGYVIGATVLENFEKVFESVALSPGSSISLVRRDGVLLVRFPRVETMIGQDLSRTSIGQQILRMPISGARSVSRIDGRERLFAGRNLDNFPVAVVVTTTVSDALADWRVLAVFVATADTLGIIMMAVMFLIILRGLRDRQASTQRRLDSQQLQLDTALNNMSQGLCMWDANADLVMCNDRYIEMYGLSREIVAPGMSLRSVLAHRKDCGNLDHDLDDYVRVVHESLTNTGTHVREVACGDGRTIAIVDRIMPDGGWVATHEDITERRNAEIERDRNREFLDGIIENIPVSIFVKNASDKRFVLMNRAGERMMGISRHQALGQVVHQVLDKALADIITEREAAVLRGETEVRLDEHRVKLPSGGTGYVTANYICIRGPEGVPRYLLSVVEDVTERMAVRQQLQQGQRMEAVARLTGGLAHDFNNLLAIIIGNLDLLAEEVVGIPAAAEKVETILQASLRGSDLTGRMLAFSRRQSLMPRRLQPNGLIQSLSTLLSRTLGGNITVELKLCDELWPVAADESQLEAALVNLAINARDAMPGGGTMTVQTRNVVLDADYCAKLPDIEPGEFVAIEVSDTGTGMSPEVLARVFEPFFTTKTPDRGTGLGLSSVFGFIRQSGGHIEARSQENVGTTFILYLPRAEALPAAAGPPRPASETGARSSEQVILVVEDNPVIRGLVEAQLSALGYRIVVAEHAADALEKLKTHKVDLLFTDMVMPGEMNGKQLAVAACAKYPGLKTLFTSGFPGESELAGAQLAPDDVLLTKPYRKNALTAAIRKALDGQGTGDTAFAQAAVGA